MSGVTAVSRVQVNFPSLPTHLAATALGGPGTGPGPRQHARAPASHKKGAGIFADPLQDHTPGEEVTPPHQTARAGCPEWHLGPTWGLPLPSSGLFHLQTWVHCPCRALFCSVPLTAMPSDPAPHGAQTGCPRPLSGGRVESSVSESHAMHPVALPSSAQGEPRPVSTLCSHSGAGLAPPRACAQGDGRALFRPRGAEPSQAPTEPRRSDEGSEVRLEVGRLTCRLTTLGSHCTPTLPLADDAVTLC